jgi:hypothetical protein
LSLKAGFQRALAFHLRCGRRKLVNAPERNPERKQDWWALEF